MDKQKFIGKQKLRRRNHVRNKLRGTADRPRMSVFRSHKHIYCQVIDDLDGKTIAAASTRDTDLRGQLRYGGNKDAAQAIGKAVAEKALAAGVKTVRFDRGSCQYHGRVAALADAAREAGLQF
jgi:large subunit ribosomal protein L18